ncbi:hypothetical protein CEXT_587221 [Caerostris extrusa]|uniref:Triple QxxK/R motif-containing protein n=1 Tax=Caerostris extrusa TaxID=172846 RepID=A0AAV4RGX2_CAEEX|nr:hypothetical protein CEXT_587221 [Caerostris extrusa]
MGRKDSSKDVPVENYRKQIGKQDHKKSKAEMKEIKAKAQVKKGENLLMRDISMLLGFIGLIMSVVYIILYFYLDFKAIQMAKK